MDISSDFGGAFKIIYVYSIKEKEKLLNHEIAITF